MREAEDDTAAALLQRAAAEVGPEARGLFSKAAAAARAEGSARLERDACLGHAELSWQAGEHSEALAHYDRALEISRLEGDTEAQGMVLLGKGFALMSTGRAREAAEALAMCKELSSSNPAQERFVADLLMQAQAAAQGQQEQPGGSEQKRVPYNDAGIEAAEAAASTGRQFGAGEDGGGSVGEVERNGTGVGGGFEQAVRAAFVKSVVLKECVVLVMEGSPSAAATPQQHAVAQALQQLRLRLHYIDTTNDAELAQEFVNVWAGHAQDLEEGAESSSRSSSEVVQEHASGHDDGQQEARSRIQPLGGETLPLLFVGGKLFGGAARIGSLRREGAEPLKQAILDALPAHMSAHDRELVFTAPEVEMREWAPPAQHACSSHAHDADDAESKEACKTQHTDRLRRLVSFVAAKVASGGHEASWDSAKARYPRDDEAIADFLSAPQPDSPAPPAQIASTFVAELSTTLGGLDLPSDLLGQLPHATAARVVDYIETVCPAQGDCNTCPTKVTCQAHELGKEGGSVDIEDAAAAACAGGAEQIEIPKAARSVKSKALSKRRTGTAKRMAQG